MLAAIRNEKWLLHCRSDPRRSWLSWLYPCTWKIRVVLRENNCFSFNFAGPMDLAHQYSTRQVIRAKNWVGHYDNRQCMGKVVRGICVYGVEDVPWLATRKELFANKFHLTFQYLAYDCLEERHRNRTMLGSRVPFDREFYMNLPTVKFSRKDGL